MFGEEIDYRPIPGFPGYVVGSDGSIWCCRVTASSRHRDPHGLGWRRLKPRLAGPPAGKRWMVCLYARGRCKQACVHSLVLLAFVGPRPDGMEACHNDGDRDNNRLSNLRWDTPRGNAEDRERHGRTSRGERHSALCRGERSGQAKLTEQQVREIQRLVGEGTTKASVARQFGVSWCCVNDIVRRRAWRHVAIAEGGA
jgi:hypothetical protein